MIKARALGALKGMKARGKGNFARLRDRSGKFAFNGGKKKRVKGKRVKKQGKPSKLSKMQGTVAKGIKGAVVRAKIAGIAFERPGTFLGNSIIRGKIKSAVKGVAQRVLPNKVYSKVHASVSNFTLKHGKRFENVWLGKNGKGDLGLKHALNIGGTFASFYAGAAVIGYGLERITDARYGTDRYTQASRARNNPEWKRKQSNN